MPTPKPELDEVFLKGNGNFEFPIVGESHYQHNLEAICGPRKEHGEALEIEACLILEDHNQYDSNAIRVDIAGRTVGHIKKEWAPQLRAQLKVIDRPKPYKITCNAKIVGGWSNKKSQGFYGVQLDLPYQEVEAPPKPPPAKQSSKLPFFILVGILIFFCIVVVILISATN